MAPRYGESTGPQRARKNDRRIIGGHVKGARGIDPVAFYGDEGRKGQRPAGLIYGNRRQAIFGLPIANW